MGATQSRLRVCVDPRIGLFERSSATFESLSNAATEWMSAFDPLHVIVAPDCEQVVNWAAALLGIKKIAAAVETLLRSTGRTELPRGDRFSAAFVSVAAGTVPVADQNRGKHD